MKSFACLWKLLRFARPYRGRLALAVLCGFLAGLTNAMLMGSIKLVVDTVFPMPGSPTLAEQLQGASLPRLSDRELQSPEALLQELQGTNAVAQFIWGRCAETKPMAAATNATPALRQGALVADLNRVLAGPSLYDPGRFAEVTLSAETRRLIAQRPTGPALVRLNRLLLEDAFPRQIARSRKLPEWLQAILQRLVLALKQLGPDSTAGVKVVIISTIPLAMLLRGLFGYLNLYLMNWVSIRTIMDLRVRLFAHLLTLPASFFNRVSTGELMSRFTEVGYLQSLISGSLVTIIREPITVISLLGLLLWQQPRLTLVAVSVLPLSLVPFLIYSRKWRQSSRGMFAQFADMGKLLHETFTGYRVVKAYNLEQRMAEEYRKSTRSGISFFMRAMRAAELPGPMIEFLGALGVTAFFIYLAFWTKDRTPGDLLQFAGSIFLLYAPVKNLLRLQAQLDQASIAAQFIFDLLDTQTTLPEPAHPKPVRAAGVPIRFDGVGFAYDARPVLQDIALAVPPGQLVALVGGSGAGKTTLTMLLLRFYDPTQGRVRIGDTDLREVATADLRRQIAVVTQETVLFNDTIRNNIAIGRPGATDAQIEAAARHAHAHEFIVAKPEGYDAVIGEKGVALSGGQRQRLAIARAILKDAPILILDEATNALDTESERAVQAALDDLMRGRTTICIAHRLSTIQHADLIVVMDQGRIVETGTHADLIQRGGTYQKLYEMQFRD